MTKSKSAAIIGAGLGGLCAAIKLKDAGFTEVAIFEKADSVGGTWRDNSYPGCSCDTPVALYQFSFTLYGGWSNTYPSAAEVHGYAKFLVETYGLAPHLHLNTEIAQAVWNEAAAQWQLTAADGRRFQADVIVPALGQLNRPMLPEINGRDSFKGPAFHSARWRHDVTLAGKRVGVIGSAASAVQLIPHVAREAGHLTVFQRSANWVCPRYDRPILPEEVALGMTEPETAMRIAAVNRQMIYDNADHFFWQAFSYTAEGRAFYTAYARKHLERQVADPALRAKLTPDYPVGCKRILFADDFYPALTRANVALETGAIAGITPEGVALQDGRKIPLDVLIFATGFETTGWHWSLGVTGRRGQTLDQAWAKGPEAHLGITIAGFPNLFMLYGPNTNLGHNTITFMIEQQVRYLVEAVSAMQAQGVAAMDVTPAAQARFNTELQAALAKTTWADPGCRSWYKAEDGRITQNWSSHTRDYAAATARVAFEDYELIRAREHA